MKRSLILALGASALGASMLSGCALFPQTSKWTPAQVAYFELAVTAAAENTAYEIQQSPELAPGYSALIIAGGQSAAAAVEAQVQVLTTGGSTSAQLQAAGLSGLVPIINNLGKVLAAPPTKVTASQAEVVALQGGLDVLQNLPPLIGIVTELNAGWIPAGVDMNTENAILQAAVAQLTAATAKASKL